MVNTCMCIYCKGPIKSTFLYGDKHYEWKFMIYSANGCDKKFWASVSPAMVYKSVDVNFSKTAF